MAYKSILQFKRAFERYFNDPLSYADKSRLSFDYHHDRTVGASISIPLPCLEDALDLNQLGSGNYSHVYKINGINGLVFKILRHTDPGYDEWLNFVQEYGRSKYLPRIIYRGYWANQPVYLLEELETRWDSAEILRTIYKIIISEGDRHFPYMRANICPELIQLLLEMRERGLDSDFEARNILFRPDGTPVITDPCG